MDQYEILKAQKDAIVASGEETIREDERQACWEDFIAVLRMYRHRSLLTRMLTMGWKDLGTGDGKPQHRLENSEVMRWLKRKSARK